MRQPLISNTQSSQSTGKYWKVGTLVIFFLGAVFVFCQLNWNEVQENAISEAPEENMVIETSVAMREEPAPSNAPLIDPVALTNAEMGVPLTMLTYTWRDVPVPSDKKKDEKDQVSAAQKMIPDFPSQPVVQLSKDSIRYHRAYLSKGTITPYQGEKRKAVILGFPGTEGGNDIWRDIQAKDSKIWKKVNGKEWYVATGFLTRYQEHMMEENFRSQMLKFVKKEKPEYIYVFGHSLGGAVATVAAADLVTSAEYKDYKVVLITFGAPRAFKESCAPEVNDYFKKGNPNGHEAWRFVSFGDTIPSLPPSTFGFEHIGRVFYINKAIGGKWTLQEQAQDFTPYHIAGMSLSSNSNMLSTHFMTEYRDRLAELHKTADEEGVFKGKKMQQSSWWDRATSFSPWSQ